MKHILKQFVTYTLIVSVIFLGLGNTTASANELQCDTDFYSTNDVQFFNPCEATCGSTDTIAQAGAITKLAGEDNQEKILNYLQSKGLDSKQAAGIAANFKAVSTYSAFHQEKGKAWPEGGYGIANFTDGQRTAVVESLKTTIEPTVFSTHYNESFGADVSASTDYVPEGITTAINDTFLVGQLNYVYQYASNFVPSIEPERVADLTKDQSLTIESGVKLIDYIKTLKSEAEVAKAWTYLYEYPSDKAAAATARAADATTILAAVPEVTTSCGVGVGGLSFEQASSFLENYLSVKKSYFLDTLGKPFWAQRGQVNQCTALIMYMVNKYTAPLGNTGNGTDTADVVYSSLPGYYEMVSKENIKPFTIFSIKDGGADILV